MWYWPTEELRDLEMRLGEQQRHGWLTASEQHQLHAAQWVLEARGHGTMRPCFCQECVRWRAQVAAELEDQKALS